jgi:hypothetical protein
MDIQRIEFHTKDTVRGVSHYMYSNFMVKCAVRICGGTDQRDPEPSIFWDSEPCLETSGRTARRRGWPMSSLQTGNANIETA